MKRKILVAYDGSELCETALMEAEIQANAVSEAEVHVLSIVCHASIATSFPTVAMDMEKAEAEKLQAELGNVQANFVGENVVVYPKVLIDHSQRNAGHAIVEYAEEHEIDMILIGSRGLGNVRGKILGSVSNKVVQRADCHVLVIK